MTGRFALLGAITLVVVTGCASQTQLLDNMQGMAMQTAVSRGQFEMNCPAATGTILSREMVQPRFEGPMMMNAIQRAEYTIGVSGCGARKTLIVICPEESDGCFAAGPGRSIREQ